MGLCCCCDLETGVKILAVLGIISAGISIIGPMPVLDKGTIAAKGPNALAMVNRRGCLDVILDVGWFIIYSILLIGAVQRDAGKCTAWFIGYTILSVIQILQHIGGLMIVEPTWDLTYCIAHVIVAVVNFAITVYYVLVVQAFIDEIEN